MEMPNREEVIWMKLTKAAMLLPVVKIGKMG